MNIKIILFIIFIGQLAQAMNNEKINCFQWLPPEIQNYIMQFLPILDETKRIRKTLDEERQGSEHNPLETALWKIYWDRTYSNLILYDKKDQKSEPIIRLTVHWFKKYLSLIFENQKKIFSKPLKTINHFVISPDQTKLAAIQDEYSLTCGNAQTGIWIADLIKKTNEFKPLPELFANRLVKVDKKTKQEYICKGYDGFRVDYVTKLFEHITIANDGSIAVADADTIYLIDPLTNKHEIIFEYHKKRTSQHPQIRGIKLSPTKALGIKHDFVQIPTPNGIYLDNVTIVKNNEENSLANYFRRKCVCKPQQLLGH